MGPSLPRSARRHILTALRELRAFLGGVGGFDRAAIVRHLSLCVAVLVTYLMRLELRVGADVLWVIAAAALLNFLSLLLSSRPSVGAAFRVLSPAFGVAGWAALVYVTGGVESPFVPAFGLEILLAATTFAVAGCALVTAGAVLALWLQQGLLGFAGATTSLVVQSGILLGLGAVTAFLTRHWLLRQSALSLRTAELGERLHALERELGGVRAEGAAGEGVERLAHGLKNAVHSLRGFTDLIEKRLPVHELDVAALGGLRTAIHQLEVLARLTLDPVRPTAEPVAVASGLRLRAVIDEALLEASRSYPAMRWKQRCDDPLPPVRIPPGVVHEVLLELLCNAAHAMSGGGAASVETHCEGDSVAIEVRDRGPGIERRQLERIFEPGYTTRPDGNGLGLFLARRSLEHHGGALHASSRTGRGARFRVELPVARDDAHGVASLAEAG
ncbi:MAG: HAMP domain-containing sensor histidine kinase [Myxococcota bacterium]